MSGRALGLCCLVCAINSKMTTTKMIYIDKEAFIFLRKECLLKDKIPLVVESWCVLRS